MGFQTYLIIVGLLYGGREEFSTEKLSYVYSKLLFYWILESAIQKGCFMFQQFNTAHGTSFLDLLSLTGYKFIPLCIVTTSQIAFGEMISYGVLVGFGALYCLFFYKMLQRYQRFKLGDAAT